MNSDISQEELAEKVDISVKHLSKIERGLTFVSADLLEKLSGNLNVSVARLFFKEDEGIDQGTLDNNLLNKFDRITEKHLIKAIEGIKRDIRHNNDD